MTAYDCILTGVLVFMNLLGITLTLYDKWAAVNRPRSRIPEATLMWVGLLFGSYGTFLTMKLIRHKTRHARFMVCLPLFTLLHTAFILFYIVALR